MSSVLSLPSVCKTPLKKFAVDGEEEVAVRKPSSRLVSAKQQKAIWDNAAHAEISAPHNKRTTLLCTAFKSSNGSMRLGTQRESI